jgi:secreted trypsin-like serine protease
VRRINRLIAAGAVVTLLGLSASGTGAFAATADQPSGTVSPLIIGGSDATEVYPAMASLQYNHKGDPNWHTCAASLVNHWYAVTNAHCVTQDDGTARTEQFHLRIGSLSRVEGGVVVDVAQILPHANWHWSVGGPDPAFDIAMLRLAAYVPLRPFAIPNRTHGNKVLEIGWGLTDNNATSLPITLQQLGTTLLPAQRCAAAGITVGELCLDSPHGNSGAWLGDSGGPGLQRLGRQWLLVGGASRETTEIGGTGPIVYTNITFYRSWIFQVIRTGTVPPPTAVRKPSPATANTLHWAGSM